MSTVTQKAELKVRTKLTGYDRTSGMLTAWVILIGFLVLIMFLVWLYMFTNVPTKPPFVYETPVLDDDQNPEGVEEDPEEPGVEEFPEVETPQLADALEAVTDIASTVKANLEAVDGTAAEMGKGSGLGDRRTKGPGGGGRGKANTGGWRIYYSAGSKKEYGKILDHFKIELGNYNRVTGDVTYVGNLGRGRPSTREGHTKRESRRFLGEPSQRQIQTWHRDFLKEAGVNFNRADNMIVQFLPGDVVGRLSQLEAQKLGGRSKEHVRRVRFKVRKTGGNSWQFYVDRIDMNDGTRLQ